MEEHRKNVPDALKLIDWERIVDTFQDGIYITNADGVTLKVNAAYERITGVSVKRVLGRNMEDIVREGILSTSITQRVLNSGGTVTVRQCTEKGKYVILRGVPIYEDGSIKLVMTVVRDITVINELERELDQSKRLAEQYKSQLSELKGPRGYVAQSPEFQAAVALAHKVADVDSTVLILGESGTGKEILAQEVHDKSRRWNQPFLKVNCGAIPETLLESELFGYDSGAFTGAKKGGHAGLFETASKGTLFLDEIGDMPLHLQVKLLRVLQERTVTRLGSTKAIPVDTRVIAATNQDLEDMVREKRFREDLYYRLNIVTIKAPPLRERKSDIPGLVAFFTEKLNRKYGMNRKFSDELIEAMLYYDWPGNVRELENIVERIMVTSNSNVISLQEAHLPWRPEAHKSILTQFDPTLEPVSLKEACEQLERQMLREAAKCCKSTYEIARRLGISQPSVSRKMKKYGIT